MCGLFAIFSNYKPLDEQVLSEALHVQLHRGPDQKGEWISPDGKVGLAQNRLSINDLSAIDLPLSNQDGTIRAIANAEIYNHLELKKSLQAKGYVFKTKCDIEVIPHLYEEYGLSFIKKLRGEFSFILWDDRQKCFYAVRDRFGIKPLYYAVGPEALYFSSEMATLLKLKVTANKWNHQSLYDYTHLSLPYSKTLFKNIHEVPPANVLSIRQGERSMQPYWDVQYSSDDSLKFDDCVEQIREKIVESVSIRLKADVPVGCYLSGGIDSSALLGIASEYSSNKIDAFNIAFDDPRVNESEIAQRTAKHSNANLHTILVSEQDMVEYFTSTVKQTCFPMPNTAGIARYLLSKLAHDNNYKAVLSGEGADEVFLGYFGAMIEASEDTKINSSFSLSKHEKETLLAALPVSRDDKAYPESLRKLKSIIGHVPSWFVTQGYFNAKHRNVLDETILNTYSDYSPYTDFLNALPVESSFNNFDNVQISSYTWLKSFFPNTMLNWIGDRAEMANSVESRQPYLDHELFDLVARIPTALKIKDKKDKRLLREAVKPFVTKELYERKKFMFQAPPLKMVPTSPLFNFVKSTILDGIDTLSIYDSTKVKALLDYANNAQALPISEKAELSYTLNSLASMILLSQAYHITC